MVLTVMLHEAVHIHEASSLALDTPVHLLATVDGHNVFGQVGQREGDVTVFTLACLPFRLGGHHARFGGVLNRMFRGQPWLIWGRRSRYS